jgi:hypothetical protein
MPVMTELNQHVYQQLHKQLIDGITVKEQKINDQMKDPVKYPIALDKKKPWDRKMMYIRHIYESGPLATFDHQFFSWWKKHYQYPGSHLKNINVKLIPKTNRTLASYLIRKKPPRDILRRMEQPMQQ